MTSHDDLFFPEDFRRALTLRGVLLAFSIIQKGDTNPHGGGRGGAEGSIGIVIDRGPGTIIHSVSPGDSGSNPFGSLGKPPTAGNCASSINRRQTSNGWVIQDYQPVGIFLLRPLLARQPVKIDGIDEPVPMEVPIDERQVIAAFPGQSIYSADAQSFFEWRRSIATRTSGQQSFTGESSTGNGHRTRCPRQTHPICLAWRSVGAARLSKKLYSSYNDIAVPSFILSGAPFFNLTPVRFADCSDGAA